MYHRFHSPHDLRVDRVSYISGDTWNTHPIALKRVERLFCKNERAVIQASLLATGQSIMLVPVAAILIASIHLNCVDVPLHLRHRGRNEMRCDAQFRKGQEMGWFQHGSTILVFAPSGVELHKEAREGRLIRMGQPLMRLLGSGD
jgi:phosphatidylserine decarboxylase